MAWWRIWESDRPSGGAKPDYYEEGVRLARQERFHDALTSFRLALKERPDDVAAIEQMAVVYTRIGLPEEAMKTYWRALELRPGSASAHYGLAFIMLSGGDREEAAGHLERFLEADKPGGEEVEPRVEHARSTLERLRAEGSEEA